MAYALITGAAGGIGRAIADELAQRGYDLLLLGRTEASLRQSALQLAQQHGVQVQYLVIDLAQPGVEQTVLAWASPYLPGLTVLVNNAGFGLSGPFEVLPLAEQLNLLDLNVRTLLSLSHAFLPALRGQPRAYLLNVASTTAYQSVPFMSVYAASKAFVVSFTRGLRQELIHTGISVSCLSPGSTDTDFVHRARLSESVQKTAAKVHMSPQAVARAAVTGMLAGKAEIIPGFINQLGAWLPRLLPKTLIERVARGIYAPE